MNGIEDLSAPLFISWQLTRDCDLACLHCCTDSAPRKHVRNELTGPEAMRVAAQIIQADVPYVMLCGGEPLRSPYVFQVAEALGAAGVSLKIETNGQLFDHAVAKRLAELPIRSIQISLDGDTQDVYGGQRPGGSLEKAHAACRAVVAAGLPLEVTFAPTRLNIHQLEAVVERARSFGAFRFNTGKLMRIGRAARLWNRVAPDAATWASFRARLAHLSSLVDGDMQIWHDPFTVEDGLRQSLQSPPATLLVLPNGWVKVVASCGQICGDLRESSLSEVWGKYRNAWRSAFVIDAIRKAIGDEAAHADANKWAPVPEGELAQCLT